MVAQTLPQTTRGGFSRHLPDSQGEGNQPALLSDVVILVAEYVAAETLLNAYA